VVQPQALETDLGVQQTLGVKCDRGLAGFFACAQGAGQAGVETASLVTAGQQSIKANRFGQDVIQTDVAAPQIFLRMELVLNG